MDGSEVIDSFSDLMWGSEVCPSEGLLPEDTDVLITHGAPYGHLDQIQGIPGGCQDLLTAVERVRPKFHVFGHIHKGAGTSKNKYTTFINASSCNLHYELVNSPIVFRYNGLNSI